MPTKKFEAIKHFDNAKFQVLTDMVNFKEISGHFPYLEQKLAKFQVFHVTR